METSDTVVVGAGVIGCATAFWLARAGLEVTVIERDQLAQHASSAPISVLAPLDAAGSDARIRAGWSSLEALREVESELEDLSTLELGIGDAGLLRLAREADCDAMRSQADRVSHYGCEWFDRADLESWDARLDPCWRGGIWSPRESQIDGARLAQIFARGAEHYGARFELCKPVVGLAMSEGCVAGVLTGPEELWATGEVIVCAGNWAPDVAHWAGAAVEIETISGAAVKLDPAALALRGAVSADGLQLVSEQGELWIGEGLAGTIESSVGGPGSPLARGGADGAEMLVESAAGIFPAIAGRKSGATWVGSYARTPDRMPLVGRVPNVEGAILATGHAQHGVLLSALTATAVVEQIVEGQISEDAAPFSPDRFGSIS